MVWNDRSIIKRVQQVLLACTERGQYDPGEGPKGQFTGRNSHPIDAGTENYHMGAGVNKKKSESWPGDMTKCICTCQWYRYIYIYWLIVIRVLSTSLFTNMCIKILPASVCCLCREIVFAAFICIFFSFLWKRKCFSLKGTRSGVEMAIDCNWKVTKMASYTPQRLSEIGTVGDFILYGLCSRKDKQFLVIHIFKTIWT